MLVEWLNTEGSSQAASGGLPQAAVASYRTMGLSTQCFLGLSTWVHHERKPDTLLNILNHHNNLWDGYCNPSFAGNETEAQKGTEIFPGYLNELLVIELGSVWGWSLLLFCTKFSGSLPFYFVASWHFSSKRLSRNCFPNWGWGWGAGTAVSIVFNLGLNSREGFGNFTALRKYNSLSYLVNISLWSRYKFWHFLQSFHLSKEATSEITFLNLEFVFQVTSLLPSP